MSTNKNKLTDTIYPIINYFVNFLDPKCFINLLSTCNELHDMKKI